MSNAVQINELGIQINFPTWEKFNLEALTNDGVILFQYLALKSYSNPEWTHSIRDIEQELGIKRQRFQTITKYLETGGILTKRIVRDSSDNKITAFRIEFSQLTKPEKLKLIYREYTRKGEPVNFADHIAKYRELAKVQRQITESADATRISRTQGISQQELKNYAKVLQDVYVERQDNFNREKNKRINVGQLLFAPKNVKQLGKAIEYVAGQSNLDKNTAFTFIKNAFTFYCDQLNKVQAGIGSDWIPEKPRMPVNYFLSRSNQDEFGQAFNVIYQFGNYYASTYGRDR